MTYLKIINSVHRTILFFFFLLSNISNKMYEASKRSQKLSSNCCVSTQNPLNSHPPVRPWSILKIFSTLINNGIIVDQVNAKLFCEKFLCVFFVELQYLITVLFFDLPDERIKSISNFDFWYSLFKIVLDGLAVSILGSPQSVVFY